jgi:protein associated with RNAse G/E
MQAAKTSMDMTYYHYNGMFYKLPENAMILKNTQGQFIGY